MACRMKLLLVVLFATFCAPTALLAAVLDDGRIAVVVADGQTADGVANYRLATEGDAAAVELWSWAQGDPAVQQVARLYFQSQSLHKDQLLAEAGGSNLSAADRALLDDVDGSKRLYIEVKNGSGGAVCDWKAQYYVTRPDGSSEYVAAPRVVVQSNDPVMSGGNSGLRSQTLVHEIGHGVMAALYGADELPYTAWLKLSHSGIMVTDQKLALIEGWAEFIGAYYTGRLTIAEDPANTIPSNRYAYTAEGRKKTSAELWKTEGWVATVLYHMATEQGLEDVVTRLGKIQAADTPQNFEELLEGYQDAYPADAERVRKIVAADSFGQIYPESYDASTAVDDTPITFAGSTTGGNSNYDFDFGFLGGSSGSSGGGQGLMTILAAGIGGALGMAIAGGPVGLIVGGLAGALLGSFLSNGLAATAAPLNSILAPAAPTISAPDASDVLDEGVASSGEQNLKELHRSFRARMKDYVRSLKTEDPEAKQRARTAFAEARERYQAAKRAGVER